MSGGDGSARLDGLLPSIERAPTLEPPVVPDRASPEQKAAVLPDLVRIVKQLNETILGLHDIIVSQQQSLLPIAGECLRQTLERIRTRWVGWEREERSIRVALAVFQGLMEQCLLAEIDIRKLYFFERNLRRVEEGRADAAALENEARILGLPVCDSEEQVISVSADFGFVEGIVNHEAEEVVNHEARVILLDEDDREVKSDVTVPLVWLPRAYRREGAGVAWVERRYVLGVKGRFEPASAGK